MHKVEAQLELSQGAAIKGDKKGFYWNTNYRSSKGM